MCQPPEEFDIRIDDIVIGNGSAGKVFSGSIKNGKVVAVKAVPKSDKYGITNLREIDIMSKFRHPNIMTALNIITSNNDLNSNLIVMDMAETDLYRYIKHEPQSLDEKNNLMLEVCRGLSFLHSKNILHMDLKMDNILVCRGTAKICDFGNSINVNTDPNKEHISEHEHTTPNYRSPEIIIPPYKYSPKSDIWALGLIIFYTLVEEQLNLSCSDNERSVRMVYEIFGEMFPVYLRKKIRDIDCVDDYIDLVAKILTIDPDERMSIDEIMSHPVFFSQILDDVVVNEVPDQVQQLHPSITPVTCTDICQNRGFESLIKISLMFDSNCETAFLAADIYHRTLFMKDTISNNIFKNDTEENTISGNYATLYDCLAVISYWMAYKITSDNFITTEQIVLILNNEFSHGEIISIEEQITEAFRGIIYRDNFFNHSRCQHDLITAFDHMSNMETYQYIDVFTSPIPPCSYNSCCVTPQQQQLKFKYIYKATRHCELIEEKMAALEDRLSKDELCN